jgi:hypothetical protein
MQKGQGLALQKGKKYYFHREKRAEMGFGPT